VVLSTVIAGAALSFIMSKASIFSAIPEGIKIILLTVIISLAAAIFFPVKEEDRNEA
jgi:hypothetical protein